MQVIGTIPGAKITGAVCPFCKRSRRAGADRCIIRHPRAYSAERGDK